MKAWGRLVEDFAVRWTISAPVDGVDNSAPLSTGGNAAVPGAVPVIHAIPRSVRKRTK
jgi:hypothetical protein